MSALRGARLVERNLQVYRRTWYVLLSGFFEPVFYLFGVGVGVGSLVGPVRLDDGSSVPYAVFVAPAMMAASAMNGGVFESTFNLFFKLKYMRLYDAVLATPVGVADIALGEVVWALLRGTLYAIGFAVVMAALGLTHSPAAALTVPAAMLIGLAFAAVGAGATTFMRSWQDFDYIALSLMPLFLFSGTFFPAATYPEPLRSIVEWTPLYRGAHLIRGLSIGPPAPGLLTDVAYLVCLGALGVLLTAARLRRLLLK